MDNQKNNKDNNSITIDTISYLINDKPLFSNINCTVKQGERLAIIGPNGSGKTTLLYIIAGLLKPSTGTITLMIDNQTISETNILPNIGFAGNGLRPYSELSIRENIQFIHNKQNNIIDELLSVFNLYRFQDKRVGQLSSGLLQRLKIILSLINDTPVLLLDEPGLNLDRQGKQILYEIIQTEISEKITVIATNDENESALCYGVIDLAG